MTRKYAETVFNVAAAIQGGVDRGKVAQHQRFKDNELSKLPPENIATRTFIDQDTREELTQQVEIDDEGKILTTKIGRAIIHPTEDSSIYLVDNTDELTNARFIKNNGDFADAAHLTEFDIIVITEEQAEAAGYFDEPTP